jgi:predicted RNA-binding Zn ribbon-like protein
MSDVRDWPKSVAGHVALDFANTDIYAQEERDVDILRSADEFTDWWTAQVEGNGGERTATDTPVGESPANDAALVRAVALRRAIRSIAESLARSDEPEAEALAAIREHYAEALTRALPQMEAQGLRWAWPGSASQDVVDRLTHAAVELLTDGRMDRIKACPSCGFLFYDTSRNGSRRWCSMDDCGAEDKAQRYVAKRSDQRRAAREQG